jgi:tetratricopeptide (TPR) repeat protein
MNKKIISLLCILSLLTLTLSACAPAKEKASARRAEELVDDGDISEAINMYEELLDEDENDHDLWEGLINAYIEDDEYKDAAKEMAKWARIIEEQYEDEDEDYEDGYKAYEDLAKELLDEDEDLDIDLPMVNSGAEAITDNGSTTSTDDDSSGNSSTSDSNSGTNDNPPPETTEDTPADSKEAYVVALNAEHLIEDVESVYDQIDNYDTDTLDTIDFNSMFDNPENTNQAMAELYAIKDFSTDISVEIAALLVGLSYIEISDADVQAEHDKLIDALIQTQTMFDQLPTVIDFMDEMVVVVAPMMADIEYLDTGMLEDLNNISEAFAMDFSEKMTLIEESFSVFYTINFDDPSSMFSGPEEADAAIEKLNEAIAIFESIDTYNEADVNVKTAFSNILSQTEAFIRLLANNEDMLNIVYGADGDILNLDFDQAGLTIEAWLNYVD